MSILSKMLRGTANANNCSSWRMKSSILMCFTVFAFSVKAMMCSTRPAHYMDVQQLLMASDQMNSCFMTVHKGLITKTWDMFVCLSVFLSYVIYIRVHMEIYSIHWSADPCSPVHSHHVIWTTFDTFWPLKLRSACLSIFSAFVTSTLSQKMLPSISQIARWRDNHCYNLHLPVLIM